MLAVEIRDRTVSQLEDYGNEMSSNHREAIWCAAKAFAKAIESGENTRVAISLDTGLGKTTLLLVLLLVTKERNIHWPVIVFVPNLTALAEMRGQLVKMGYPANKVGVVFNDKTAKASELKLGLPTPKAEWANCPVMLACHARANTQLKHLDELLAGRTVVHDESITKGFVTTFTLAKAESEVARLKPYLSEQNNQWLDAVLVTLKSVSDQVVTLPTPPENAKEVLVEAISVYKKRTREMFREEDSACLVFAEGAPLRVTGSGVFSYVETFPRVEKLFVLDANYAHSELSRFDESIHPVTLPVVVKLYNKVVVKQRKGGLGRETINKNLDDNIQWARAVASDAISNGQKPLVLCFAEHEALVKRDMPSGTRVVTWGMHAGSNDFRECNVVICLGVLRWADLQGMAHIALVKEALDADVSRGKSVVATEQVLALYQGVSRSSARLVEVDWETRGCPTQAKPCTIFLCGSLTSTQQELLKHIMLGSRIEVEEVEVEEVSAAVYSYLAEYGATSSKALRHKLKLRDLRKGLWDAALQKVPNLHTMGRTYAIASPYC
jgi:hypothetical protein